MCPQTDSFAGLKSAPADFSQQPFKPKNPFYKYIMATHDVLGDIKLSKKQYFYVIEVKGTLKVHEWVYYRPF